MEDGQGESGGLTGAGLGQSQNVPAFHSCRDRLLLDRGGFDEAYVWRALKFVEKVKKGGGTAEDKELVQALLDLTLDNTLKPPKSRLFGYGDNPHYLVRVLIDADDPGIKKQWTETLKEIKEFRAKNGGSVKGNLEGWFKRAARDNPQLKRHLDELNRLGCFW